MKPRTNLRLFVAVYPPPSIAETLIERLATCELPPHRLTPTEQIHLTLQFIGDMPSRRLDTTIESVDRAAAGLRGTTLHIERFITLPDRGPARLVAAATDLPATIRELHERLARRFATRVRRPDGYLPHLTLARFRTPAQVPELATPINLHFDVRCISLMRSTLQPSGAIHHLVHQVDLG